MFKSLKVVIILLLSLIVVINSNKVIGVGPEDSKHYVKGQRFRCLDGSKEISYNEVNDDFCDCVDGSDEPGTSACINGKFYCANEGHQPLEVPHSFVNDGLCDCCDGSDEPPGKCKNTCEEKGRAARLAALEKEKILKEGSSIKNKIIQDAKASLQTSKQTLEKLQLQARELESKIEKLQKLKEKEEEKARLAEELKKKESGQYAMERCETLSTFAKQVQNEIEQLYKLLSDRNEQGEVMDLVTKLKSSIPEHLDCNPPILPETEENKGGVEERDDSGDFDQYGDDDDDYQNSDGDEVEDDDDDDDDSGDSTSDKLRDVENKLSKVKNNIEKQEKIQSIDFGTDQEYFNLYGECFQLVNNEYKYEMCPFNKATQSPKNGGSSTDLGKWEKWENGHSTMKFANGQGCWQGPARSVAVQLECGIESEIISVEEPSKCEYLMRFKTPAACQFDKNGEEPSKDNHSHNSHHESNEHDNDDSDSHHGHDHDHHHREEL